MCDACQMNEATIRGMKGILDEVRQILSLETGQSVVEAVKDLVAKEKTPEKITRTLGISQFTPEERTKIMSMLNKFQVPFRYKSSFEQRVRKLANAGIEELLSEDEYWFILQMRKKSSTAR